MPVEVSREVLEQLDFVRQSGATNMFDRFGVRDAADFCGFDELIDWINETPRSEYGRAIMEGVVAFDSDED